ncbi:hypothetical protein BKA63DRAFT_128689 [Paraphoma chrysanthemicola]|nr:hypothetical protein BKA63DRAFT_128689 [Paraphoma chrysanthemicola]
MSPPRKDEDEDLEQSYSSTFTLDDDTEPTVPPYPGKPVVMSSPTPAAVTPEQSISEPSRSKYYGKPPYTGYPPGPWVTNIPRPWETSTLITKSKDSAAYESQYESKTSTSPTRLGSAAATSSNYGHHPDWPGKGRLSNGGLYAAAAITPIVVLALIGGFVFFCMRKRKRRAQIAATQQKVEEMKMQPRSQPSAQPYMAPPTSASPQYSPIDSHPLPPPTLAVPHPIILGPIPSGSNGAYFTGIDTSDVVSVTSASNARPVSVNPFNDNESLVEPPPPYRPRSAAPPSLTNSSRHSSFRASVTLPATSRTHLIERSPFEDPVDDDVVSDLSGPTTARGNDNMSAVSDLSYQQDPVVNRSSL